MSAMNIFSGNSHINPAPVIMSQWTPPVPPDPALDLMPENTDTFLEGLQEILHNALPKFMPSFSHCLGVCISIFAVILFISVLETLPKSSVSAVNVAGALAISNILLRATNSLLTLGVSTIHSISEYGKVLIPVMTAALAGSGGVSTSTALYAGTTFFNVILCTMVSAILIPLLYIYLCIAIANCALGDKSLSKLQGFLKWLMTWCLKTILYLFTGYISITGVVSGTADAAAIKATKLTISGMVPVIGGILSDASEAVLVSAGLIRTATGIYGLLASMAICITPFLQIGIQYLVLKFTGAVCDIFGSKSLIDLLQDFTWCMGMLLAMTGSGCVMIMISVICFMRGVG